jgi:deoxyribonuclease-4
MSTDKKLQAVLQQWGQICGIQNLRVFHMNDSVGSVGSRRDCHAHIGTGLCGRCCFRGILNHPAFQFVPKVLETPKGLNDKGVNLDLVNLRRLRRMTVRTFFSR